MPFPGFQLRDAYRFAAAHGLEAEARAIRSLRIDDEAFKKRRHVPRKGAFVELFETKGLMDAFVEQHWPTRHTPAGEKRRQQYLDGKALNDRLLRGEAHEDEQAVEEAIDTSLSLEADLEDALAANLDQLEKGLRLYEGNGSTGRQVDAKEAGRIDMLAADVDQNLVVIELKAGDADRQVCGQIQAYMGWVKQNLAGARSVRGIIIAHDFTERAKLAATVVPGLSLKKYQVNFVFADA